MIWLLFFALPARAQQTVTASEIAACSAAKVSELQKEAYYTRESELSDSKANFYPTLTLTQTLDSTSNQLAGSKTTQSSIGLEQKLLDFSTLSNIGAAKHRLKAAQYDLANNGLSTSFEVLHSLTLQQQLTDQILELDRELEGFTALISVLDAGHGAGLTDSNNLLQSRSTYYSIQSQRKTAEIDLLKEQNDFKTKFSFNPPKLALIKTKPEVNLHPELAPSVKTLVENVRDIEESRKSVEQQSWPSLSLRGTYSATQLNGQSLSTSPSTEGTASLVVDLSGIWKNSTKRAAFSSIKNIRENAVKQQTQVITTQIANIDTELESIQQRLPLLEQQIEVNEQSRKVTKAKLRLGKLTFLELQQTETSAFQAALEHSKLLNRKRELLVSRELISIFSSENLPASSCPISSSR